MDYIKQHYQLPFLEKGMKVEADGKFGKITREKNGYIEILFESGKKGLAHPTWEMVYYDEAGNVIKDFRKLKTSVEEAIRTVPDLVNIATGETNIEFTPNLKMIYIADNNWEEDKLIAVSCTFTFFGQNALAFIVVEDLQPNKPRYAEIESTSEEIHASLVSTLNKIEVWEKLVPVLKEYKSKWEEYQKQPF
ncbi:MULTISPECIES: hypothetical protein [unclassified Chryseobacterium]|uniref:hypothetical protein n=1 Tax=unclassified Chryseobacterium TaxID=2593645 RepID=UPI0030171FEA